MATTDDDDNNKSTLTCIRQFQHVAHEAPIRGVAADATHVYTVTDATLRAYQIYGEGGAQLTRRHEGPSCQTVCACLGGGAHVYTAHDDGHVRAFQSAARGLSSLGRLPLRGSTWRRLCRKLVVLLFAVGCFRRRRLRRSPPLTALAAAGEFLYDGASDGTVHVRRCGDGHVEEAFPAHEGPIRALAVGDDGDVYTAGNGCVRQWRRHVLVADVRMAAGGEHVMCMAVTEGGQDVYVYVGCAGGCIFLLRRAQGQDDVREVGPVAEHPYGMYGESVAAMAVVHGVLLVAAYTDGSVSVWRRPVLGSVLVLECAANAGESVHFLAVAPPPPPPSGHSARDLLFVTAAAHGRPKLWRFRDSKQQNCCD